MQKRLLCFFLFAFALAIMGHAQQIPTTQGKEFWLSFMRNGYRYDNPGQLVLIASAEHACTVTVTNPNKPWSVQFEVSENNVASIIVPDEQGYNDQIGQTGDINKGLYVTADSTISLYIANDCYNSYDAANVLPTQALGCRYMIQTNQSLDYSGTHSDDNRSSFLVVATENNTQVRISPTYQTMDGHSDPYTITLQRGQCYHVLGMEAGDPGNLRGDLSGTWVESIDNKPIAVFNGNCVTSVNDVAVSQGLDHVFEQAMPVDNWGTHFVLTKTKTPPDQTIQNDRVKITALYDNTVVKQGDGSVLCTLNTGASHSFWLTETCSYLESNSPIAVYLYNHSHSSSNTYGDPSMVWISPVEQNLRDVIFSTFSSSNTDLQHFVNVVCHTDDVSELYLNGNPIPPSEIQSVSGASEFSFARVQIEDGMNRLQCSGGLVAHVYGNGDRQGYAYTVGSSARDLTNQLFVNDELVMDDYSACQSETLVFRLETNYEPDLVKWNYGDGSPVEIGTEVLHAYADAEDYEVEVTVDHVVNGEPRTDTLGMIIHVNPKVELTCVESTCSPVYVFQGIVFPVPFFGDTIITNAGGCESIYHMDITEGSSQSFLLYDTACLEYEWFDTVRYVSGTYIVVLNQPGGCDSLFILNLTIGKPPENPVRYKYSCAPYDWDGVLCEATDVYHHQYETEDYCVYDSVLYFTRYYEPSFEKIVGSNYVAVATNFWPGEYVYHLDDNTGLDAERLVWWLDDNDDPDDPYRWVIKPLGTSCAIIAYSQASKTLHVKYNGECPKERELVINCTGYAVGEQGILPLEVYPNPAKDELIVKGCEMEEVVLYNLLGQQVKSLAVQGGTEVKVHIGDLPQALYLLEIRTKYGNNTRLVSVIN